MPLSFRVLYAEDNAQDAEMTLAHFAASAPDFEIVIVRNGEACLARATEDDLDLVLLDHRLPDMDGLDILRSLAHSSPNFPLVLVTGVGDEDLVVKALRLGAANYVPKQGDYLQTLPDLLRSVIQEHRASRTQHRFPIAPRRVLYVEHHTMDIDLTRRHFAEQAPQFELDVVRCSADALACLARPAAYDVALIDLRMYDQSGLDLIREAKLRRLQLPPFVMISGKGDEQAAIASLKLGASDYVIKRPGYLDRLIYVIERAVAHDRQRQLTERLNAELLERRRADAELTFRNIVLSTQQDTSPDGILVVDGSGNIVSENRRFAEMWQLPSSIVRTASFDLTLEWISNQVADPKAFQEQMRLLCTDPQSRVEDEILLCDGRAFERYCAPMRGADGEHFGRVWYFRNVTARRQAEAARNKAEEQLRVSQKLEALGSLAGGVAHDFNNLLSVILSFSGFALELANGNAELIDDLSEVRKAAERASTLTRQLLAFGRKQVLRPVSINLNDVANALEKMLRRILGEDIEFVQVLAPDLGVVRVDASQIDQVLMNLVVNARDAMPKGGRLTITTTNLEVSEPCEARDGTIFPGSYVQVSVTDTGCGMDDVTKARLFEPFFTTKGTGKGTGLGLSTAYGIIKQSGGEIRVRSELGRGSCFQFVLPRSDAVSVGHSTILSTKPRAVTGTETVLVVEDEEALRVAAARALSKAGYTVLQAANGAEALEISSSYSGTIHLLLTDVVMPGMSGVELAREIGATRPDCEFLYMSGYAHDALGHHGILELETHFLAKPFTALELSAKVRLALDGARDVALAR